MSELRTSKLNQLIKQLHEVHTWLINDEYLDMDYPDVDRQIMEIQNATDELVRIYLIPPVDGTTRSHTIEDE